MEYCPHCRAIRPTRKSSRKRTVRQPDGTTKIVVTDSYHCTRCNAFVGSVDRDAATSGAPAAGAPAAGEEGAAAAGPAGDGTVEVGAGSGDKE